MFIVQQANSLRGVLGGRTTLIDHVFSAESQRRLWEPPGVNNIARPIRGTAYNGRYYLAGGHTSNVFIDEHYRLLRLGMMPPIEPPTVVCAGGTESYETLICYISYWDAETGERSSLSGAFTITSPPDTCSNNRTWSDLPTVIPNEVILCMGTATIGAVTPGRVVGSYTNFDMMRPGDRVIHSADPTRPLVIRQINTAYDMDVDDTTFVAPSGTLTYHPVTRATHIELWVSVEGALPRLAGRARIGHTVYGEQTTELQLGEAFLENFEPFPLCSMNAFYQDRHLMAGDDKHRDVLYLSELFYPERYAGLNFKTRNGDPITGIMGTRDYALVYTNSSTYILQGYTENDLTFRMVSPEVGAFGHVTNALVGDMPWQFNQRGVHMFNGAHHHLMLDRKTEWQAAFVGSPTSRTMGFAVHNIGDSTVQFWPQSLEGWIADYAEQVGNPGGGISQPNWSNDSVSGTLSAAAYITPTDMGVGQMYYGVSGKVYVEEEGTAGLVSTAMVRTGALDFGIPGGDMQEAKNLKRLWTYVVSEESYWILNVLGGDEYCFEDNYGEGVGSVYDTYLRDNPWKDHVEPSQIGSSGGDLWARQVVHVHSGIERISGRRFAFQLSFLSPVSVVFIGLGGVYGPGVAYRGQVRRIPV